MLKFSRSSNDAFDFDGRGLLMGNDSGALTPHREECVAMSGVIPKLN
ncbi:hypothetical protein KSF_075210 [Reticulibacter mediterranei]|uniref:Uncharacterized protein n=1 Tax=Reticulibacter mediterranei TaxID=2778369 RepID=A0A8J3INX8_9CHLR|nr:hypothetical protein KSF_075210 [Reticulibacter mediterranei]